LEQLSLASHVSFAHVVGAAATASFQKEYSDRNDCYCDERRKDPGNGPEHR
jgi:hypothetical protein